MARHTVCRTDEIRVGELTRASIGRFPIVLCRLPCGEIKAFSGRCPHQGADLAYGCIVGATSSELPNTLTYHSVVEVLRWPWHGFEFCLKSGRPAVEATAKLSLQLRFYQVEIDRDQVVVVT
jgi:nitrite reductase/ring-hydroxylating ferredoxin subunit